MLKQILKDMYIDPDVLNALNEEQKKTLFLKMRQEQVRRWKEHEEKLQVGPETANSKNVSWLLGRGGEVAVIVIGEVDELTSKFICSAIGEKKTPSPQNNANCQTILKSRKMTEPIIAERENAPKTQPGISINLEVCRNQTDIVNLKITIVIMLLLYPLIYECERISLLYPSLSLSLSLSLSPLPDDGASEASWRAAPDEARSAGSVPPCAGRGRVAQLMKTFSAENATTPAQTPPRGVKPPLPTKPNHLRLAATPTVR
uniref:Uncharacterized protein n=1 Tax=Mola mola TaxID=94237 RepID=A0A3Q3X150_MOLML